VRRAPLLWASVLVAVVGAGLFAAGPGVGVTLLGAGVLGVAGTTLLTVVQAVLSDRHGERRDRALTEANVGAGGCAVVAPLALGALAGLPGGWRLAFALPVLGFAALYLRYRHEPLPAPPSGTGPERRGRLPRASVLFVVLVALGMAVEFCLVYFGAEQLTGAGLSTTAAATAMSSFYLGILAGRVAGAVLARRPGRSDRLLLASLAVTAGGFLLFWLGGPAWVAVLGLLVAGLGVANLYPLSLARALDTAPGQEDRANARTQLLGGVLVVLAPYLLGALADRLGLAAAFGIVPVLVVLCLVLLVAGQRTARGVREPALSCR
jgi:MFS family permease